MGKKDPRVDAYIAEAAPFARPILAHLRRVVHRACPEVEETIKWGMPSFEYRGILCGMAAFKRHCTFGFWKSKLMDDPHGVLEAAGKTAMGNLGCVSRLSDLPAQRLLTSYVKQAAKLNEQGVKLPATARAKPRRVTVPADLKSALARNKKARATFESFPPSHKREYVEWVTEAKREETRVRRLRTAVQWMAQGKSRNWKYTC